MILLNRKMAVISTLAVLLPSIVIGAPKEELGGTVVPFGLRTFGGDFGKLADHLRLLSRRGGFSRFTMVAPGHAVRITGMLDVEGYAKIGRDIRKVQELVAPDGIKLGYNMSPTHNCGIGHSWQKFVNEDGSERKFTACIGEEGFRRDFAAKCAALAREAQPFLFMIEDDFRYFGKGCFCPNHLRRFSELTGTAYDRKTLLAALKSKDPANDAIRLNWHAFLTDDLLRTAKAVSAAVAEVAPDTRIGLCSPGGFPLRDTARIAAAFAGRHRPVVRWYGAIYGNDFPIELAPRLNVAQWAKENLGEYEIECIYEADPCPHNGFFASASRMDALMSSVMAMGYSAQYFWAIGSRPDALETTPEYLDLHARRKTRYERIRDEGLRGRLTGVEVVFEPAASLFNACSDPKHSSQTAEWYRALNRMGVPVTTTEAPVKLFSGHNAFRLMSDAEVTNVLSGGVFLDGSAAEALTMRGVSDLIGVEASLRDAIDFSGERSTGWRGFPRENYQCSFHSNFGLDGSAVSRLKASGAESVTVFVSGKKTQPAITWFENRLGGKVAVMAVNLASCKSANLFSFAKRELLVRLFRRLGGESSVPARIVDRANVKLLANEDAAAGRLLLHAVSLHCDTFESMLFEVAPPYAGGRVEILDGADWQPVDASWDGNRIRIRSTIDVYGNVVLRIFTSRTEG